MNDDDSDEKSDETSESSSGSNSSIDAFEGDDNEDALYERVLAAQAGSGNGEEAKKEE